MAKSKKNKKYDRTHLQFSKEQKIKIVQEIDSGQLTKKEAMEKYNIVGHATSIPGCINLVKTQKELSERQTRKQISD